MGDNKQPIATDWQQWASLPASLYSAEQLRALDRRAIAAGTPALQLMQRAARAALAVLQRHWPQAQRLSIYCGGGSNGGDGYLLAKLACERGLQVTLIEMATGDRLRNDAALARAAALSAGIEPCLFSVQTLQAQHERADVVVDALLGTGLNGVLRADYAAAIAKINCADRPVLALDIPSGLCSDTGRLCGEVAVQATATVTFVGLKLGLFTAAAVDYIGRLSCHDLALGPALSDSISPSATLCQLDELTAAIPRRHRSGNKNQHGHLLIIGGDHGMGGAPLLAAQAALRCGVGLVTVATRASQVAAILSRQPEVMALPCEQAEDLTAALARATAVVVGPGLGKSAWGQQLLQCLKVQSLPILLDADALNLSLDPHFLPQHAAVITPHSGEAARLLGSTAEQIDADRLASAAALHQYSDAVAVLKGAGTVIASGEGAQLCPYGNAAMATAGMGDVLSGVIGAYLAQGVCANRAAALGVSLHAAAADAAVAESGLYGFASSDMPAALRRLINDLLSSTKAGD